MAAPGGSAEGGIGGWAVKRGPAHLGQQSHGVRSGWYRDDMFRYQY